MNTAALITFIVAIILFAIGLAHGYVDARIRRHRS